ncbi:MAG: META domain-containing protein [Flavobacteriaceae bacterium]|nr:META domain-containing protein [Flavobacteriaceae bacterium]
MRNLFFLMYFIFLELFIFGCTNEGLADDAIYPETILGDWDIEGGGTLFFDQENFSISAGCNTLFGAVRIEENTLVFSMIATTLIACPEAEGGRERELTSILDGATLTYEVVGNKARLFNSLGELALSLIRPDNVDLVNVWELTSIRTENAVSFSILDEGTGITFTAYGTVEIITACNLGEGKYSGKGSNITFEEIAFTEKGCEQELMIREQEYTQALSQINSYSILRKTLSLQKDDEVYLSFSLSE